MPSSSNVDEIQIRMRQVRRDLDEQVDGLVDNAIQITEQMTDWRSYVTANPWLYMGAATAIGYLVVPTQVTVDRPVANTLSDLAKSGALKLQKSEASKSILDQAIQMGVGLASNAALQFGLGWVNRNLKRVLTGTQAETAADQRIPSESEFFTANA